MDESLKNITETPPEVFITKISKLRIIHEALIGSFAKDGSKLKTIHLGEKFFLRNQELPEKSMAIWQFFHSYIHTLFEDENKREVFGDYDRAQVASIVSSGQRDRVHYYTQQEEQKGAAENTRLGSAISAFDGHATTQLIKDLGIQDEWRPAGFYLDPNDWAMVQGLKEPTELWMDCGVYRLIQNANEHIASSELKELMDEYWAEFAKLNGNKLADQDRLKNHILTSDEMIQFEEYKWVSSLNAIHILQKICQILTENYDTLSQGTDANSNKNAKLTIFALHICQTMLQRSILWWCGVTHGHLHGGNTVSKVETSPGSSQKRLETRIIDFDQARISVEKLIENNDIYQMISPNKVKALITDRSQPSPVRMTAVYYLPLKSWDEEVVAFVKNNADPETQFVFYRLLVGRVGKDISDPPQFTWIMGKVFELGLEGTSIPNFRSMAKVLNENIHLITDSIDQRLRIAVEILKSKSEPLSVSIKEIPLPEQVVVIAAIFQLLNDTRASLTVKKHYLEQLKSVKAQGQSGASYAEDVLASKRAKIVFAA